jgi:hypothetical protein
MQCCEGIEGHGRLRAVAHLLLIALLHHGYCAAPGDCCCSTHVSLDSLESFRFFATFLVLSGAGVVAVTEQEQGWGASCCLACLLMVASVGSAGGWVASPVLFALL